MRKKRPKGEYLREIVKNVGLSGRPSVENEVEFLADRLTADELSAVARLLDRALAMTHCVTHLPYLQGLQAIAGEMVRMESKP